MAGRARHDERHFRGGAIVRDVVLGMSDGLTVPFALAAGLTGAVASSSLVVTAGVAEIAAGCIAMGLGGFLAAQGEAEHYRGERRREQDEVAGIPEEEEAEMRAIFARYGVGAEDVAPLVAALKRRPEQWVDFMMRFELGLEEPDPGRGLRSAATIGLSYAAGGLVPLSPYLVVDDARRAMPVSAALTLLALAAFGAAKGKLLGARPLRSAAESVVVGGLAAAVAWGLARILG
jgi:VIT1/CCC1 family predicted Fe2+/Mn2+ transporter